MLVCVGRTSSQGLALLVLVSSRVLVKRDGVACGGGVLRGLWWFSFDLVIHALLSEYDQVSMVRLE